MNKGTRITWSGFALVGVAYGLVRFSYGQFLPQMRAELELSETVAGFVSSGIFFGACLALIIAAQLTERFGPRWVAFASGFVATLGLFIVSIAQDPLVLASALALAGISTGLSMPPLVAAVSVLVKPDRRDSANAIMNAGTCAGIVISGPIALYYLDSWREVYAGFAFIGLLVSIMVLMSTPASGTRNFDEGGPELMTFVTGPIRSLLCSAFIMGFITSAYWSFGGDVLISGAGWSSTDLSIFWMVLGAVGFFGAAAGGLIKLFGVNAVHRGSLFALVASLVILAFAMHNPVIAYISGVLFGIGYIMVTGTYIVWGTRALPNHPASAVAAAFFMIPAGQVVGAPVFGALLEFSSSTAAFCLFATIGLVAMLFADRTQSVGAKPSAPQPQAWPDGSRYEGEWRNGLPHGYGVMVWSTNSAWAGDRYAGQWANGMQEGRGTYHQADGPSIDGTWRRGVPVNAALV